METNENIFDIFIREICSNCKKDKYCQEELRIRLDGTVKCYEYERLNKKAGYEKFKGRMARQNKPIMKKL